jgi:hypothetical protein
LPQLVYSNDENPGQPPQEKWTGVVRDASEVEWKPALQAAILMAIPAGLLSSQVSRAGLLSLFWMTAGAAWAVTLYVRNQRSAWITMGAGARIGLVTGIMAGCVAFSVTGIALFVERFVFHQAGSMDQEWRLFVDAVFHMTQQMQAQMGVQDQGQTLAQKNLWLSPEGHAGMVAFFVAARLAFMVLFAAAGGAMGARLMARTKRPPV